MKVQISKIKQNNNTTIIIVEYNDELFASSRSCDDCITLTEDFCKEWLNQGEPEEVILTSYDNGYIWLINDQMIEVVHSEKTSLQSEKEKEAFEKEIENQITLFYDKIVEEETPAAIEREKSDRKHKLVKKQDLPRKVNFEMLITSPYSIWNGGYEKAETQSINETVQQGELAAQNLELFISLMKNPKFATKASFEIEKILKKTKTI